MKKQLQSTYRFIMFRPPIDGVDRYFISSRDGVDVYGGIEKAYQFVSGASAHACAIGMGLNENDFDVSMVACADLIHSADAVSIFQSEHLKVGERARYFPKHMSPFDNLCIELGIRCWVERRAVNNVAYGITFEGKEYEAGGTPRDLAIIRGIAIARGLL